MVDINLVPQEIKTEQQRTRTVKTTTLIAVALTIIVALISSFLLFQTQSIKAQTNEANKNIQSLRGDINGLSEIEVSARNLDLKSKTVESVLAGRVHYSLLMAELKSQIPANVILEAFGTGKENTVNLTGSADDYLAIAQFANNLADKSDMFAKVSLNSVNLDSQSAKAKFFIIVTLNPEALQK